MAVADDILNLSTRHAVLFERFKTREVGQVLTFLNTDVLPDLEAKLTRRLARIRSRGFDSAPWTTQRYKDMIAGVNQQIRTGMIKASDRVATGLQATAISEAEFVKSMVGKASAPLDLNLTLPSPGALRSLARNSPFRGKVLGEWFTGLSARARDSIDTQLRIGLAAGETTQQIISRIRGTPLGQTGVFGELRRNTESTVRTAINHTSAQAKELTYAENSDVVKAVQYVATLDSRTTVICAGLDGEVFPISEGPRPPQHFSCRSTTIPVLKSFEELGIPLKELPPGTRASVGKKFTGQVPARQTYGQWLKKQPAGIQNEVLGSTRARLFRQGKVKIDRFTDTKNRPLTLDQIRKREGLTSKQIGREVTRAEVRQAARVTQGRVLSAVSESTDITALIKQLEETTDKKVAKRIRARLRKLGHTGGLSKKKVRKKKVTPPPEPTVRAGATRNHAQAFIDKTSRINDTATNLEADLSRARVAQRRAMRSFSGSGPLQTAKFQKDVDNIKKQLKRARRAAKKANDKFLQVSKPAKFDFSVENARPRREKQLFNHIREMEKFVSAGGGKLRFAARIRLRVRAFASSDRLITLAAGDAKRVTFHEIGHILEESRVKVKKAATDFLKARTAGEPAQKLSKLTGIKKYKPYEIAKPDRFEHPYMGRIYKTTSRVERLATGDIITIDTTSTEIISMGVERMILSPDRFAVTDPEYFNLIFNVLHGNL